MPLLPELNQCCGGAAKKGDQWGHCLALHWEYQCRTRGIGSLSHACMTMDSQNHFIIFSQFWNIYLQISLEVTKGSVYASWWRGKSQVIPFIQFFQNQKNFQPEQQVQLSGKLFGQVHIHLPKICQISHLIPGYCFMPCHTEQGAVTLQEF